MNPAAIAKARREDMRWLILVTLWHAKPYGMNTAAVLPVIQGTYRDATHLEVRRELEYLQERGLVKLDIDPLDNWFAKLDRYGTDVVEYAVPCDPGITRPTITQI